MAKITKKALMLEALSKYTPKQIEKADYCVMVATLGGIGNCVEAHFPLTGRGKLSKRDRILKNTRSTLHNTTPDERNKRMMVDTSSENIHLISIKLK